MSFKWYEKHFENWKNWENLNKKNRDRADFKLLQCTPGTPSPSYVLGVLGRTMDVQWVYIARPHFLLCAHKTWLLPSAIYAHKCSVHLCTPMYSHVLSWTPICAQVRPLTKYFSCKWCVFGRKRTKTFPFSSQKNMLKINTRSFKRVLWVSASQRAAKLWSIKLEDNPIL